MKIELNEILNNSHNRNMKERIIIIDDNDEYYSYSYPNIPDTVKIMKVERYGIVSEKIMVIKVRGVINE